MMMPRSLSKKYPLIPSAQSRASRLAPLALIPAVPVRLGGSAGPQIYAAIDTGAKISTISEHTLQEFDRAKLKISRHPVASPAGSTELEIVVMSLLLCDPAFAPWIELSDVPFAIVKEQILAERTSRILLGFDSCLAKVRIDIDYPRNVLTVYAPAGVGSRSRESQAVSYPSRIREGELLIAMGSYGAAVAMIAAAVEEAVVSSAAWTGGPARNWKLFMEGADQVFGLEPESRTQLETMWRLRNVAVHGPSTTAISRSDAEAVLRAAKEIITKTSKAKSRT